MLVPVPTPSEKVVVGGVELEVRGLTLGEVKDLDAMGKVDAERTGIQAVAWGCGVSFDEAKAWIESTSPQFGAQLAEHIMRLSGMTEETGARFPERLHEGRRRVEPVCVVRRAPQDTGGAEGDAV